MPQAFAGRGGVWLAAATAVVGALTSSSVASAAERAGAIEIGVFGGWHSINSDNELGNARSGDFAPTSALLGGLRFGMNFTNHLALEVEGDFEGSSFADTAEGVPIFGARFGLRYTFTNDGVFRPFGHLAAGSLTLLGEEAGRTVKDTDAHYSIGLGAFYDLSPQWALRGDLRYVAVPGNETRFTHDAMVLVGITWTPGATIPDSDGDGIADDTDKCVQQKEDKDGFQDDDGCPEADNDSDGLADGDDRCPNEAETRNGYRDEDGCPDSDKDGDRIGDSDDKCPTDAEDRDGFQDEDGCPDPDNDKDGVADAQDRCPNKAEDRDGFQDDDGCPEDDNDGDGVPDASDKCKDKPETPNGYEDDDGCPDAVPEKVVKSFSGKMEGIQFDTGKATIKKSSNKVLDKAYDILAEFPSVRIEIAGHTDDVGDASKNQELSQARAESVKSYLVGKGLAADRIVAKGYGATNPVAENKTAKGKAANRRIEFHVITGNR